MKIDGITVHQKVTADAVVEACERAMNSLADPGFCVACGAEAKNVEPDARLYKCRACGEYAVYGAQELLLYFC